jgi:hypothetical protein
MPYIELKGLVKKVNLKPNGEKEILLVVPESQMKGKLDSLSDMIGCPVEVSLESMIVNYNVTINTQTNKPVTEYKVDDKGVVHEVKPEGEQLEADLGLPPAKISTKEEKEKAEREIVDEFILSGMAPSYDELPYDFANIVKRRLEGETYSKLASELNISSGKIVDLIDEYRKRVAPLAMKWWEWKQGKEQPKQEAKEEPKAEKEDKPGKDGSVAEDDKGEEKQDDVA